MVEINRVEAHEEEWTLSQAWNIKWTRKIILIGCFLGFFDQLTGINTAMYYLPKILESAGFSAASSIELNVITGLASCIGAAFGLCWSANSCVGMWASIRRQECHCRCSGWR